MLYRYSEVFRTLIGVADAALIAAAWLTARPSVCAEDMTLSDGSHPAQTVRPRGAYWRSRTALDVIADFDRLRRANPHARAFRLQCSQSCRGRLCHGSALASELRAQMCADCV